MYLLLFFYKIDYSFHNKRSICLLIHSKDREIELRTLSPQLDQVQGCAFTKCLFLFPQRDYLISHCLYRSPEAAFSAGSGCQDFYRIGSCLRWCRDAPGSPRAVHPRCRLGCREAGPFPGGAGQGCWAPCGPKDLTGWGPGPWRMAPPDSRVVPPWVGGRGALHFILHLFFPWLLWDNVTEIELLSVSFLSFHFGH